MTNASKMTNEELAERIEESAKWSRGLPLYDDCQEAVRRLRAMDAALEYIAESRDAGRHDGKREACPANYDYCMWLRANEALGRKVKK